MNAVMNVRRFCAPTSREALNKLRDAMGPDAVIISNRNVNGMVEILALADEDMAALDETTPEQDDTVEQRRGSRRLRSRTGEPPEAIEPTLDDDEAMPPRARGKQQQEHPLVSQAPRFTFRRHAPDASSPAEPVAAKRQAGAATAAPAASAGTGKPGDPDLMAELREMRGMMQQQLAELSWSNTQKKDPLKGQLMRDMLCAGFSAGLSRYLIDNMPKADTQQNGHAWLKAILANNLHAIDSDADMLEAGGVFALVGPTGVGKTTTTAKLAARCVMRHGANKLALITTDGYRIGGYEQLRIYGKILGVMVHAVKDEADLRIALSELRNKHTVLIDTVGMSQRDKLVAEQVAMLSGANVNKLLCLNATSNGDTLSEVIRSYQGAGLSGCIITKMDEAAHIGSVLDAVIRHKLALHYVANGQRVPEDLHVANKQYLVDHAFRYRPAQSAWQLQDDDLPMLMAGVPGMAAQKAMATRQQSGVSRA